MTTIALKTVAWRLTGSVGLLPDALRRGHDLLERIEAEVGQAVPRATVATHLEALEDPASWEDQELDRPGPPPGLSLSKPEAPQRKSDVPEQTRG